MCNALKLFATCVHAFHLQKKPGFEEANEQKIEVEFLYKSKSLSFYIKLLTSNLFNVFFVKTNLRMWKCFSEKIQDKNGKGMEA